jgi:ubiquinone/menaquinone biosynthesis C-methylase UbiE
MTALNRFAHDYATPGSAERYVNASLPNLPFDDESFDITLSGHFLFTYSDRFDYGFHLKSLLELVRVSRSEVRIYPVVGLNGCKPGFFDDLLSALAKAGVQSELIPSRFEFQKGGSEILRLTRHP